MNLVVIEGIGKLETVQKYLGSGYKVFATGGHVRDLPEKRLAVNVDNDFEPTYVIMNDKKDTVAALKKVAAAAEKVLLATDPDREGEAISWHVATLLDIPEDAPVRIEFNEISKSAVQNALSHPRAIDKNLVDAQQARRVLDRLVGYKVSPVLCKKIQNNLSAGRVQSVTLRLVVDREREIQAFVAEEYWNFFSVLAAKKGTVKAALVGKSGEKFKPSSADEVEAIKRDLDGAQYKVSGVKKTVTHAHPYAPFITSTMQQDALNKLGMSLKQTSSAAQTLYEGVELSGEGKVALITYIRTDSTRVSAQAIAAAREFIGEKFGKDYLPEKPNYYASKKSAQDAHEAIRPISLDRTPQSVKAHLNKFQYQLYDLIYKRFLASQMSDATYDSVAVDITANGYDFHITGRTPKFDGYTKVYAAYDKDGAEKADKDGDIRLPEISEGDILDFVEYDCEQKFTKPPARYTEASLVKAMEEKGIGRPATYSPTITILFSRKYVERDGRAIKPTELGMKVTDMLIKYFSDFMNVGFTAVMEDKLDGIEDGGKRWQDIVSDFYTPFADSLKAARADDYSLKEPDEPTDYVCEKCGAKMVIKTGRFGRFLACPNYPKCKNTKNLDENGNIAEPTQPEVSDVVCEKCGALMVVKTGRYGKFLACPNFPKCKNIVNLDGEKTDDAPLPPCPKCGKPLKKITTRRSTFYGCSGYPDCDFTASSRPTDEKCPQCGSLLLVKTGKNGGYLKCSNKECSYKRDGKDDR